jgi:hypothetical protein
MPEGSITEPIIKGNQVLFTSPRLDLHAEMVPIIRDVGDGELEIVVRAMTRPNYVLVAVLGDKLLLTNGVHKVLALIKRGYNQVPCVWHRIDRVEEAGVGVSPPFYVEQRVVANRPAAVIDFLNAAVAVPLAVRSMYQVMRLAVMSEQFQVPAIQEPG